MGREADETAITANAAAASGTDTARNLDDNS
jgi:hypothetical protein